MVYILETLPEKSSARSCNGIRAYVGNTRSKDTNTRIIFLFNLFCGYIALEYVRVHVIYRVNQAEYAYLYSCGCATEIPEYVFPM